MNKKTLALFNSDPDLKKIAEEYQKKKVAGLFKVPRKSECRRLKDLCLLVFKMVHLNGEHQMLEKEGSIKTWIWAGHDFQDRIVDMVEEIVPRLTDTSELEELRLVATKVSSDGIERLMRIFPNAKVNVYTEEQDHVNWQLSQANYKPDF